MTMQMFVQDIDWQYTITWMLTVMIDLPMSKKKFKIKRGYHLNNNVLYLQKMFKGLQDRKREYLVFCFSMVDLI